MHLQSEVEEQKRWNGSETECDPPNSVQVVHAEYPEENKAHKVGDGECKVEHGVGGWTSV